MIIKHSLEDHFKEENFNIEATVTQLKL